MWKVYCAALTAVLAVAASQPEALAEGFETATESLLSPAQILVFNSPHLKDITSPTVLTYRFERKSKFKDGFTDEMKMKVDRVLADGAKDVSFDIFSGGRHREWPAVEHFKGNPIIMIFLQRDAWEMQKLLGGNANYFRTKVRYAFRDAAEISDVEVQTANGPIKGQKVTLRPFLLETKHAYYMGPNIKKVYEFTFSPQIPGELYMIRTYVPPEEAKAEEARTGAQAAQSAKEGEKAAAETTPAGVSANPGEPTIEETLVFESAAPLTKSAAQSEGEAKRSEE